MATTPKRPLGTTQLGVLQALQDPRHGGVWYAGCGWIWSTVSETKRLLDSLVNRGLVTREERPYSWTAAGARYTRTRSHYTLTDAGRAVDTEVRS